MINITVWLTGYDDPTVVIIVGVLAIFVLLGSIGAGLALRRSRRDTAERDRLRDNLVALEEARRQLSETENSLQDALVAAITANHAKEKFLGMVGRELRKPLNTVIGFSDLLRQEKLGPLGNENYVDYAENIYETGAHLLSIIGDVLDMAKADSGEMTLVDEEIDLRILVHKALQIVEETAAHGRLLLTEKFDSDLPMLRGDERRVRQILLNLLTNAIKFTPAGGGVTVSASRGQRGLAISVSDTGIGMAPEHIPIALEYFGQIDNISTNKQEGAGIGLPLSKQLAELQGGTLSIDSAPGTGTTVTVTFPAERLIETNGPREAARTRERWAERTRP